MRCTVSLASSAPSARLGLLASTMLCTHAAPPSPRRARGAGDQADRPHAERRGRDHRHRPEARGESPGRADRDHRASAPRSSTSCRSTISTIMPATCRASPTRAPARASPTSISAASPAARTPTIRPRCPRSAPISTSSRSRRSPARSTSTSSTSPGSRRWPGRRARSTAPRARPARSASSPTSPIPSGFYGEANVELNNVAHGEFGYTARVRQRSAVGAAPRCASSAGTARMPAISTMSPARLTFPTSAASRSTTTPLVEKDYNDVETYGARAALKIDLDDNWTVTAADHGPEAGQRRLLRPGIRARRAPGPAVQPRAFDDRWVQAALTVEGKIGNFDMTYAGAYMKRQIDGAVRLCRLCLFLRRARRLRRLFLRQCRQPGQSEPVYHLGRPLPKQSHELRIASPADRPVRFIGGLFYQRQTHNIEQNYIIDNIADAITVPGTESNIWLTQQLRVDRDYAVFGEIELDITPQADPDRRRPPLPIRQIADRLLRLQRRLCEPHRSRRLLRPAGRRRVALHQSRQDDVGHRLHPPPQPDLPDHRRRIWSTRTWSRGFRPGGINRRGTLPPYGADFIDNYEIGFKTELVEQPAALQRRHLPARLDQHPIVLPRRQRPHRDPQRRQRPHPRRRVRHLCARPARGLTHQPRRRLSTTPRSPRISA